MDAELGKPTTSDGGVGQARLGAKGLGAFGAVLAVAASFITVTGVARDDMEWFCIAGFGASVACCMQWVSCAADAEDIGLRLNVASMVLCALQLVQFVPRQCPYDYVKSGSRCYLTLNATHVPAGPQPADATDVVMVTAFCCAVLLCGWGMYALLSPRPN